MYRCKCCGELKNKGEFYKDSKNIIGLKLGKCKQCTKENYEKTKEKKIDYQKQWNKKNREKTKIYMIRYKEKKNSKNCLKEVS